MSKFFKDFSLDSPLGESHRSLVESISGQLPPSFAERWVLDACIGKGGAAIAFLASARNPLNGSSPPVVVRYLQKRNPDSIRAALDTRRQGPRHPQFAFPESDLVQGPSGAWFHAMSYIPGPTLASVFSKDPSSDDFNRLLTCAYDLALKLTAVVAWLESYEIVHRDLKPSNLAQMPEGELGVFDFDLARPRGFARQDDKVNGTPRYIAPELLQERFELDHRGDLYSAGVSVLERLHLLSIFGLVRASVDGILKDKVSGVASTDSIDCQARLRRAVSSDVDESLRDMARRLGDWLVAVLRHQPDSRPFPAEARSILTNEGNIVHCHGPVDSSQKHPVLGQDFACEGVTMKILEGHERDGSHWWDVDVRLPDGAADTSRMVLRRFDRSLKEHQLFPAEFCNSYIPISLPFFGGDTWRVATPESVGDYKLWLPSPGVSLAKDLPYQTGEVSLIEYHDRCMRALADTLKRLSVQCFWFAGLRWEDLTTHGGINMFRPGVSMRMAADVEDALSLNLFVLAKAITVGFAPPNERGFLTGISNYDFVTSEQKFLRHYSRYPLVVPVIRRLFAFLKRVHSIGMEPLAYDWSEFWDIYDRAELERTFDLLGTS